MSFISILLDKCQGNRVKISLKSALASEKTYETVIYDPHSVYEEYNEENSKFHRLLRQNYRIVKISESTNMYFSNGKEIFFDDNIEFFLHGKKYEGLVKKSNEPKVLCNDKIFELKKILTINE